MSPRSWCTRLNRIKLKLWVCYWNQNKEYHVQANKETLNNDNKEIIKKNSDYIELIWLIDLCMDSKKNVIGRKKII